MTPDERLIHSKLSKGRQEGRDLRPRRDRDREANIGIWTGFLLALAGWGLAVYLELHQQWQSW